MRVHRLLSRCLAAFSRFAGHARGNVAIIFALSSVAIALGVGAALDLSGAYAARQRLSEVATLTCQYSVRPSVVNTQSSNAAYAANPTNPFAFYLATVNQFAANALAAQHMNAAQVSGASGTAYYTQANASSTGTTQLSMSYPTAFLRIINVNAIPVQAKMGCQNTSQSSQVVTASTVLSEGFEVASCTVFCFTLPSGVSGALQNPTATFGATPTYTGSSGFAWYVIGYCLEVDSVGVINASDPEGTHSAELDCDNANHTAGNSSMSTKVYLQAGTYELRYFYRSRIDFPVLDPYYVCGASASELAWFNNAFYTQYRGQLLASPSALLGSLGLSGTVASPSTSALRTNQMNVYLDPPAANGYPPLHSTTFGTASEQLAGANMIDSCLYSIKWVERSVTINVAASGSYWLSFAADGQDDSYGAQLDNIRLCPGTCTGAPQDNFPDTTPQTTPLALAQSVPLTVAVAGQAGWGWNSYVASGTFITPMCGATTTAFWFAACGNPTTTADTLVFLDPGFYELSYQYLSAATYNGAPRTGCSSAPSAGDVAAVRGQSVTATDPRVLVGSSYATKADVDMTATFLVFPGQTLTPNIGAATTLANPLVDLCYYSTAPITRKLGLKITKPGLYDLAFYAAGTAATAYQGGAVGTLTSLSVAPLGSPFTLAGSTSCPAVLAPDPQVGTTQTPASTTAFTTASTDPFQYGATSTPCAPR